jgi:hypothetical protein
MNCIRKEISRVDKNVVNLDVHCDMAEAESKVVHLIELLKEASALVDELASEGIRLEVSSFTPEDSNGKHFGNSMKCNRPN